jgi:Domain of unknown function (DUF4262)
VSDDPLLDDLLDKIARFGWAKRYVFEEPDEGRFEAGLVTSDFTEDGLPVAFIDVVDVDDLATVEQIYGHVDAVQMVWADRNRLLPWQAGYEGRQFLRGPGLVDR